MAGGAGGGGGPNALSPKGSSPNPPAARGGGADPKPCGWAASAPKPPAAPYAPPPDDVPYRAAVEATAGGAPNGAAPPADVADA